MIAEYIDGKIILIKDKTKSGPGDIKQKFQG